jgi:hypothetical protein
MCYYVLLLSFKICPTLLLAYPLVWSEFSEFAVAKVILRSLACGFTLSARHALRSFLGEFALEFRVSFIQATPKGLLLFVPVLVMNTLGFIADALRRLNSI